MAGDDREQKRAEAAWLREIMRHAPAMPDPAPPFPVEPPLDVALYKLAAGWVEAHCSCGHVAFLPLRLMAAERGWPTPLGDVLPRLRCARCRAQPAVLDLVASPSDGAVGSPGAAGRRVKLLAV